VIISDHLVNGILITLSEGRAQRLVGLAVAPRVDGALPRVVVVRQLEPDDAYGPDVDGVVVVLSARARERDSRPCRSCPARAVTTHLPGCAWMCRRQAERNGAAC
jgi:hypothetical protein